MIQLFYHFHLDEKILKYLLKSPLNTTLNVIEMLRCKNIPKNIHLTYLLSLLLQDINDNVLNSILISLKHLNIKMNQIISFFNGIYKKDLKENILYSLLFIIYHLMDSKEGEDLIKFIIPILLKNLLSKSMVCNLISSIYHSE